MWDFRLAGAGRGGGGGDLGNFRGGIFPLISLSHFPLFPFSDFSSVLKFPNFRCPQFPNLRFFSHFPVVSDFPDAPIFLIV